MHYTTSKMYRDVTRGKEINIGLSYEQTQQMQSQTGMPETPFLRAKKSVSKSEPRNEQSDVES